MNKGCIIFAHDSYFDYGSLAVLAARLSKKHLQVPVSLITDADTATAIESKFKELPFDKIIVIEKPSADNFRHFKVNDGYDKAIWKNQNRFSAYELSPYDRTLVIDSDFLIFSNRLSQYWDDPNEFLISPGMFIADKDKMGSTEYVVDHKSINMLWATNLMFSKSNDTKKLFELVNYIKQEYQYYSSLYHYDVAQYRNDYTFSIACHIMSSFGLYPWHGELPIPLCFKELDEIVDIKSDGTITHLINYSPNEYICMKSKDQDVHVMNKFAILNNFDQFMELAND
jgi:hypothetical protein